MLIRYAKVTAITEQGFFVTFLGETEQSQMIYKRLSTYIPRLGDKIAILEDKLGKKIVMGEVI